MNSEFVIRLCDTIGLMVESIKTFDSRITKLEKRVKELESTIERNRIAELESNQGMDN